MSPPAIKTTPTAAQLRAMADAPGTSDWVAVVIMRPIGWRPRGERVRAIPGLMGKVIGSHVDGRWVLDVLRRDLRRLANRMESTP